MEKGLSIVKTQVAIIMGSQSDAKVMREAALVLKDFGVRCETKVVSAHRTPEMMQDYAQKAETRGVKVIIAGAGGAAHLPGMVASLTVLPVIGVPVAVNKLKGLDSLLSIAQMPKGVPVATVAIDNAHNAALLALRILALDDRKLSKALHHHRQQMKIKVHKSQATLKKLMR
jgi:phosphoribosylaminoimidazole carboxylase PurE protein